MDRKKKRIAMVLVVLGCLLGIGFLGLRSGDEEIPAEPEQVFVAEETDDGYGSDDGVTDETGSTPTDEPTDEPQGGTEGPDDPDPVDPKGPGDLAPNPTPEPDPTDGPGGFKNPEPTPDPDPVPPQDPEFKNPEPTPPPPTPKGPQDITY